MVFLAAVHCIFFHDSENESLKSQKQHLLLQITEKIASAFNLMQM